MPPTTTTSAARSTPSPTNGATTTTSRRTSVDLSRQRSANSTPTTPGAGPRARAVSPLAGNGSPAAALNPTKLSLNVNGLGGPGGASGASAPSPVGASSAAATAARSRTRSGMGGSGKATAVGAAAAGGLNKSVVGSGAGAGVAAAGGGAGGGLGRKVSVKKGMGVGVDGKEVELGKCSKDTLITMIELEKSGRIELDAVLNREREEKDQLLERLSTFEQTSTETETENSKLLKDLRSLEGRLKEQEGEVRRMEEDLARRTDISNEIAEKLRTQVRDLEKKSREVEKRYKAQSESFDSERQAFLDTEQHLKLRISNLASKQQERQTTPVPEDSATLANAEDPPSASTTATETEGEEKNETTTETKLPASPTSPKSPTAPPSMIEKQLAMELSQLRSQLSSLAGSNISLERAHRLVQSEVSELKRVNAELMEMNESYEVLLGERTLMGVGTGGARGVGDILGEVLRLGELKMEGGSDDDYDESGEEGGGGPGADGENQVLFEEGDHHGEDGEPVDEVEKMLLESQGVGTRDEGAVLAKSSREHPGGGKRKSKKQKSMGGSGLDLAAELEQAEEKGGAAGEGGRHGKDASAINGPHDATRAEIKKLKAENKMLQDANKALSLYVSKIIDRIVAMDGFETVLAADWTGDNNAAPGEGGKQSDSKPSTPVRSEFSKDSLASPTVTSPVNPEEQQKTRSLLAFRYKGQDDAPAPPPSRTRNAPTRRSISIDWRAMNPFKKGGPLSPNAERTRPMPPIPGAAKVEGKEEEDEEDLKEREKIRTEMAKHGLTPGGEHMGHGQFGDLSVSGSSSPNLHTSNLPSPSPSPNLKDNHSLNAKDSGPVPLAAIEVIKEYEARERDAKQELEKGRASGFTEPVRLNRRASASSRSRRSINGMAGVAPIGGGGEGTGTPSLLSSREGSTLEDIRDEGDREAETATVSTTATSVEGGENEGAWKKAMKRMSANWERTPGS